MSFVGLLRDSRRENKHIDTFNDRQVAELMMRAEIINKQQGKRPATWEEFKKSQNVEPGRPLRNALIGALIGAVAGAAFVGAVAATIGFGAAVSATALLIRVGIMGAAAGALIGWDQEITRENNDNSRMVKSYEAYIDGYHQSRGHAKEGLEQAGIEIRDDHVKKLQERSEQEPTRSV